MVGTVSAEAVALARDHQVHGARQADALAAAVLIAGLVTIGAGVMAYSASRQENAPRSIRAMKLARGSDLGSHRTHRALLPRNRPRIKARSCSGSKSSIRRVADCPGPMSP